MQLEAKRAKMASLLEEQAICNAARGAAKHAAEAQQRQKGIEAVKKEELEASRRVLEGQRAAGALQLCRDTRLAACVAEQAQIERQWQVREGENERARVAAEAGRDAWFARKAAEQEAEAERQQALKALPQRVRSTDGHGNMDYSKTYFHVSNHAPELDELVVEAEFHRPLSPAPAVTPMQRFQATNRGLVAEAHLAIQRHDEDREKRLATAEAENRAAKVQQVLALQAAAAPRAVPVAAWGVLEGAAKVAAEAEMADILAQPPANSGSGPDLPGHSNKHNVSLSPPKHRKHVSRRSALVTTHKPSPAWGAEARTAVAIATHVHSTSAGTQTLAQKLDDTFDTSDSSSAGASVVGTGAAPFHPSSPCSVLRKMRHMGLDADSLCTDSPDCGSMFYDDLVLDGTVAEQVQLEHPPLLPQSAAAEKSSGARAIASNSCDMSWQENPLLPQSDGTQQAIRAAHPVTESFVMASQPNVLDDAHQTHVQQEEPPLLPQADGSDQVASICAAVTGTHSLASHSTNADGAQQMLAQSTDVEQMTSTGAGVEHQPAPDAPCVDSGIKNVVPTKLMAQPRELLRHAGPVEEDTPRAPGGIEDAVDVDVEASSGQSTERWTPTGFSPLPGADRLAGLLSEAEALLRETAITAAMASAAANEPDPFLDSILATVTSVVADPVAFTSGPSTVPGELADAEALLNAVDGFLGATRSNQGIDAQSSLPHDSAIQLSTASHIAGESQVWVGAAPLQDAWTSLPALPASARQGAADSQWVSDARRWGGGDLSAQLDGICAELDDIVGLSTARGRELDLAMPGSSGGHWLRLGSMGV